MDYIRPSFYIMFHHLPIYFPKLNGHNSGVLVPYFQTTPWFTARRFAAKVLPNMRGQTCSPRHRQTSKGMRHVLLLTDCIDNRREADLGATHTHTRIIGTHQIGTIFGGPNSDLRVSQLQTCLVCPALVDQIALWYENEGEVNFGQRHNPFFLLLKHPFKKKGWCGTSVFFWLGTIGFLIVVIENQ